MIYNHIQICYTHIPLIINQLQLNKFRWTHTLLRARRLHIDIFPTFQITLVKKLRCKDRKKAGNSGNFNISKTLKSNKITKTKTETV